MNWRVGTSWRRAAKGSAPTVCLCLIAFSIGRHVEAQVPEDAATLRSILAGTPPRRDNVQERLETLIEVTRKAREERQSAMEDGSGSDVSEFRPSSPGTTAPTANGSNAMGNPLQHDAASTTPTRSLSEIRERIRILQRLRRDRSFADRIGETSPLPDSLMPSGPGPVNSNVAPPAPAAPTELSPSPSVVEQINQNLQDKPTEAAVGDQQTGDPSMEARTILPQPVNTLALGESLYRVGNYESALAALKKVDADQLSQSDRTWLDLLIALCQRRSGDYETAEGTLRDIANEESSDYPVKAARWWLKHTAASSQTVAKMNTLSTEFNGLLEKARNHVK